MTTISEIQDCKKPLQSTDVVRVVLSKVPEADTKYYYYESPPDCKLAECGANGLGLVRALSPFQVFLEQLIVLRRGL
jgi:hypothetical protein